MSIVYLDLYGKKICFEDEDKLYCQQKHYSNPLSYKEVELLSNAPKVCIFSCSQGPFLPVQYFNEYIAPVKTCIVIDICRPFEDCICDLLSAQFNCKKLCLCFFYCEGSEEYEKILDLCLRKLIQGDIEELEIDCVNYVKKLHKLFADWNLAWKIKDRKTVSINCILRNNFKAWISQYAYSVELMDPSLFLDILRFANNSFDHLEEEEHYLVKLRALANLEEEEEEEEEDEVPLEFQPITLGKKFLKKLRPI